MESKNPALLIIDVQRGFTDPKWGTRNNPTAEQKITEILSIWRSKRWPVIHVKHNSANRSSPLHRTSPGNQIIEALAPLAGEILIEKSVNSAFIGTSLESELHSRGIQQILIVGLTTPHCVSTTARMAGNLGFETFVASDGTAAFDWTAHDGSRIAAEVMHFQALAALHGEFATVATANEVLPRLEGRTRR